VDGCAGIASSTGLKVSVGCDLGGSQPITTNLSLETAEGRMGFGDGDSVKSVAFL
jgi:hypothetical protein